MVGTDRMFSVTGKTAVVTGASSGLGVTFAEALARAGANVVLTARRTDKLKAVGQTIAGFGGTALPVACDVSDAAQVKAMAEAAAQRFGRVDILVNNAGAANDVGIMPERMPNEVFEQTIRVNVLGLWYCCREVGQLMLGDGKGGSIINIASIWGFGGVQNMGPAYQASKGAVINLTRHLACSWGDRGVRVNTIAPGYFPSEMTEGFFSIPTVLKWAKEQAPLGRIGDPAELAGALLFLASDAASYVTGQTLYVDGGVTAAVALMGEDMLQVLEKVIPEGLGKRILPS